ncbi:hypothetical protein [Nocardiopsis suaedae]|uniref:DUF1795 domain-containing protein n=1 Tax=Nocardiopsis suaedae TaxID=3018444 RepID=A0ABT4TFZ6_9ACTN|nr:hypothetical protein [Nocardiopsis suaedae]MDA2803546.1 hypothetical protein [Nocardiopsis suaedae]
MRAIARRRSGAAVAGAAVAAAALALTGCGGAEDGAAGQGGQAGGEDAAIDAPEGFQAVDADWLAYAVPDDWEPVEGSEEADGEHIYESVAAIEGEGDVIMASTRVIPVEGVGPETHAQQLAGKFGAEVMIGNKIDDMQEAQEHEVEGADSSARNDYSVEQFRIDYIDADEVTDVFVVAEGPDGERRGAILRVIVSDGHIGEDEQETIVDSLRVAS